MQSQQIDISGIIPFLEENSGPDLVAQFRSAMKSALFLESGDEKKEWPGMVQLHLNRSVEVEGVRIRAHVISFDTSPDAAPENPDQLESWLWIMPVSADGQFTELLQYRTPEDGWDILPPPWFNYN